MPRPRHHRLEASSRPPHRRSTERGRSRFLAVLSDEPHAGEILLGENSVLTLGNHLIGPNCVLPTGGHARSRSPLSVHDFTKRTSIAQVTRAMSLPEHDLRDDLPI
jgi:Histidinol dehydrogenase